MPKKKIDKETLEDFLKRQYNSAVIKTADNIVDRDREVVPTVLSLDLSLSGGIPEGVTTLISGRPGAGKTTLSLHILANAIQLGRPAFYIDVERRCQASLLKTIKHLDVSKLNFINSQEQTLAAEDWLTIIEHIVKDHPKAVILLDSIAAMSTKKELKEDFDNQKDMAGIPKLLSLFFRRSSQIIDNNNIIFICLSRLMTNRDPTSKKRWLEKGGVDVQHAASVWLNFNYVKKWDKDVETNAVLGHDIHVDIIKSALGKPWLPCSIPLRFGDGIDSVNDIIVNAENMGLITKAGSWYSIPEFGEQKYQGLDNLRNFLINNPKKIQHIENIIRKMVFSDASESN